LLLCLSYLTVLPTVLLIASAGQGVSPAHPQEIAFTGGRKFHSVSAQPDIEAHF
jgi:hypothetical protein